ncbi:MAG: hypothetical protein E7046_00990 [Lentisphaerae bacterium]|nr:hypothetical protein [Lentisphaerota bacterium]
MGIDEQIKKVCELRQRKTVIGIRVNDRELERIDQKVKDIGTGATRADVLRGSLVANGIID